MILSYTVSSGGVATTMKCLDRHKITHILQVLSVPIVSSQSMTGLATKSLCTYPWKNGYVLLSAISLLAPHLASVNAFTATKLIRQAHTWSPTITELAKKKAWRQGPSTAKIT